MTETTNTLLPHQERVVREHMELQERTRKLEVFVASSQFAGIDPAEQDNLREQLGLHWALLRVLRRRIAGFGVQ